MEINKKKISHISRRARRKLQYLRDHFRPHFEQPVCRAHSPVQEKIEAVHEQLPPRFLLLDFNEQCNLRCNHCDFWKNKNPDQSNHRTPQRTHELIAEFAQLSPHGVVVTCGGEPMLDLEEWLALCRVSRESGLPFFSVTNGILIQTPEMAERLILEGPDEISLSLDSPDPEIHDRMRGMSGAFDKTVRALRLLLEARARHPEIQKPIIVMGLVCKTTYRDLESFFDLVLNQIGADKLKLNIVQPTFGRPKRDRFFEEEGEVNPRRLRKSLNRCDQRFSLGLNPVWIDHAVMYFRSLPSSDERAKGWRSHAGTKKSICNAVDRNIEVDLYGNARHCFSSDFGLFPLKKEGDLRAFWASREARRDEMLRCNRFCAISHSLRAESATLAGVRKAELFIEKSLRTAPAEG